MSSDSTSVTTAAPPAAASPFRRALLQRLALLREGELILRDGGEQWSFGSAGSGPRAVVEVHDPRAYGQIALGGSVGVAEAYMEGWWSADDLVALVRLFVLNRDVLDAMEGGWARWAGLLLKAWHAWRRNTLRGSRQNIAAHYDLGNELFRLFLDQRLMYSAAIFVEAGERLERASERKLARICQKLDLAPGQRLIEIGTGWGGFALYAARHHGVHVTTTTLSREQYDWTRQQVAEAGLGDRIEVLQRDYRALEGRFDRLVSIEMIEAIGHQYLPQYFATVSRLLTDDGLALIQAITIEEQRYRRALHEVDFIKRYIFPGSFIPSVSAMLNALPEHSDLRLLHLEDIGPSYALTLREWRRRFLDRVEDVRALGYSERFVRMWDYYLAYCEGGFLERSIGDVQMLLAKPRNRRRQYLPDLDPKI